MEFLQQLNIKQREAVTFTEGPSIVIAGAGSGKTRVLTYKIAYLISQGVDPFRIMALTFTNKAAREMRNRIEELVGPDAKNLWMNTFHTIFSKILRIEYEKTGYPRNFTIYDTDDSKALLRTLVREMSLDDKLYNASTVLGRISSLKNRLISVEDYFNSPELMLQDKYSKRPELGILYKYYQVRLFKSGAMDFDDLLFKTYQLLTDHPNVLYKYQNRFYYVLVDEFQDTNLVQHLIVRKLSAQRRNITVVGDDAQSIYSFRGAEIANILNFEKDYPDLKIFKLEQNYRSSKNIVEASNHIIKNNKNRLHKEVWTENEKGEMIHLYHTSSDTEEGRLIADHIFHEKMTHQLMNSDFAVLYRTNSQSKSIEESLRKLNIKYRVYGGMSFYQRKEIKDLSAYLRVVVNANDEQSLKRIINYPRRGIGDTTIDRLQIFANDNGISLWTAIECATKGDVGFKVPKSLEEFYIKIKSFQSLLDENNAFDLAMDVARKSGIMKDLGEDKTIEGIARFENLQSLLNGVREFIDNPDNDDKSLGKYLQEISLYTDADDEKADKDTVSLMTVHSAKGLEFPFVFVSGLEEGLFPSQYSISEKEGVEEERRLFYVAVTRAKRKLTISYATSRYKWGSPFSCVPSRFIGEIPENYIFQPKQRMGELSLTSKILKKNEPIPVFRKLIPKIKIQNIKPSINFAASDSSLIAEKMKVEHARFGCGLVTKIIGNINDRKATIQFENHGEKVLLLQYAKLKIVE